MSINRTHILEKLGATFTHCTHVEYVPGPRDTVQPVIRHRVRVARAWSAPDSPALAEFECNPGTHEEILDATLEALARESGIPLHPDPTGLEGRLDELERRVTTSVSTQTAERDERAALAATLSEAGVKAPPQASIKTLRKLAEDKGLRATA